MKGKRKKERGLERICLQWAGEKQLQSWIKWGQGHGGAAHG